MPITLVKGENVSLTREDPGLTHLLLGLGWEVGDTQGEPFDLDTSIFMLDADGRVTAAEDFIFYNNLVSACGSVVHSGDNQSGEDNGDAENISIDLTTISPVIERLAICVSIHLAEQRLQNFGMVKNAYVRVLNKKTAEELVRFSLSDNASIESAVLFGELYRFGSEWKFRASAEGHGGGLADIARSYGVDVA